MALSRPVRHLLRLELVLLAGLLEACASTEDPVSSVAPEAGPQPPALELPSNPNSDEAVVAEETPPSGPRLMTRDDYERFESARGESLTEDGSWLQYQLRRADDTRSLVLVPTSGEPDGFDLPWASGASFSADMGYVAWRTGVSDDEREKLNKSDEPFEAELVLTKLVDRSEQVFPGVVDFAFDADGTRLAVLGYGAKGAEDQGADLRIIDLESGATLTLGNVGDFAWCDLVPLLAIELQTGTAAGNGVQLYDADHGRLIELDRSTSDYRSMSWREDSSDLAILRSVIEEVEDDVEEDAEDSSNEDAAEETIEEVEDFRETDYVVLAWRGLHMAVDSPLVLDPQAAGIEDAVQVVEMGGARWSEDGSAIAIGLKRVEAKTAETDDDLDLPGLQIWHSKDVDIYPQAKARARWDARRTLTGVWHLDENRLVRIDENRENGARLTHDWDHAIEQDDSEYAWGEMFGRPYHDVYLTDVADGSRRLLLEKVRHGWASAYGRYYLSFDGEHYWADDLRDGSHVCLTSDLATSFANAEYDTPTDLTPPYGVGGWLLDDAKVLLNDRYDVWEVELDGSGGRRLTDGTAGRRIHRVVRLDLEEPGFDSDESLYFRVRGDWSERQGFAVLTPDADQAELLFEGDYAISRFSKATDAEVFLYSRQNRETPPQLFVAGAELNEPQAMNSLNTFLSEFLWTRSELVEWTSGAGVQLQGALLYPAGYEDGDGPAPMIVYTYEQLSQGIHRWQAPSELDYYNYTVWTQAGYFVLMPDIVYRPREPGPSAIDAVVPAVARVVELGLADADRVGLIGHSWGGYNAAYLPTRTDIFAASVAGAPLTNFISFMGQIHWSGGIPETNHWETGQGRMEVPYWEDRAAYLRSSPLEGITELNTPMLMTFGDEDGSVDWDQGTEFYNYVRRAGKEMVLLVYEGEGHGLREEANRRDYQRRILEWFGHYLKGEPAPAWITEGVSIDDIEAERARLAEPSED